MTDQQTENLDQQENTEKDVFAEISSATGKNYPNQEAVTKALVEKDNFIEQLKEENRKNAELVEKLLESQEKLLNTNKVIDELSKEKTDEPPAQTVDKEEIKGLVSELLTQTQQEAIAQQNLEKFSGEVKKYLGDGYQDKLVAKSNELQLSVEDIKSWAAKSPDAALRALGVVENKSNLDTPAQPSGGSRDIPASNQPSPYQQFKEDMAKRGVRPGTAKYYRELMSRGDLFNT